VQQWSLHDCDFQGWAKALLWFQKVVIAKIEFCRFVGDSDYGIWLGQDNYVTAFQIKNCMFAANNVAHIQLDNFDGEMITISECTFEAGTNTPAVVQGPISHCGSLLIEKNWCGDASGTIDWFQITSSLQYSASYIGNYIVNGAINSHAFVLGTGPPLLLRQRGHRCGQHLCVQVELGRLAGHGPREPVAVGRVGVGRQLRVLLAADFEPRRLSDHAAAAVERDRAGFAGRRVQRCGHVGHQARRGRHRRQL
jgi:hypothetical protein